VTGTKLCLRKCGSRECKNHAPGLVMDNTLYVRSGTSGTALTTTVFRNPTLSIIGLEKELVKYIIEADDSKGPLSARSLFPWLQKTSDAYTEAVEIHENVRALPLKTRLSTGLRRTRLRGMS